MESRNFILDTEWNMIHYPEKPNGFGILVIGDERHFVNSKGSFWTQNEGKRSLLNKWKSGGYTIFYSNLYGRHWGSQKAVELAMRLCSHIIRNEILNGSFHIVAEGMGALVALKLLSQPEIRIRSLVLLNPIFSLSTHLDQEKENKFFYKKLVAELENAYELEMEQIIEALLTDKTELMLKRDVPVKVIHVLSGSRSYNQSKTIKDLSAVWEKEDFPVSISYILPEKKQQVGEQTINFFAKHEHVL